MSDEFIVSVALASLAGWCLVWIGIAVRGLFKVRADRDRWEADNGIGDPDPACRDCGGTGTVQGHRRPRICVCRAYHRSGLMYERFAADDLEEQRDREWFGKVTS